MYLTDALIKYKNTTVGQNDSSFKIQSRFGFK